jgi:uncharacterized protein
MPFALSLFPHTYAVVRLPAHTPIPVELYASGDFCSITQTPHELSIVCEERFLKAGMTAEKGWRLLAIKGTLQFNMVGVLSELSSLLANAGISIFVISTHDTDYIMVKELTLEKTKEALASAGHTVEPLLPMPVKEKGMTL